MHGRTVERRVELLHEGDEEDRISNGKPALCHALQQSLFLFTNILIRVCSALVTDSRTFPMLPGWVGKHVPICSRYNKQAARHAAGK